MTGLLPAALENLSVPSSQVHPLETKSPIDESAHIDYRGFGDWDYVCEPITRGESQFRHSSWSVIRRKTFEAMKRTSARDKRMDAFANCGSGAFLYVSKAGSELSIRCNKCHDRFCLACQRERAGKIVGALLAVMSAKTCRFLTLTLRHSPTPLSDQIDRLYRSFGALRRRKSWKEHVVGGAAFLEIKVGRDGLWHPHLHCVIEGKWWDAREISKEWHSVTGDSSIIDLRKITDDGEAAGYVTKYVTKPASSDVYHNLDLLDEMMIALRGRRLCMTFSSWRGINLHPDDTDDVEWQPVGSLQRLRLKAVEGDADSIRWIEAALRKWPNLWHLIDADDG